MAVAVVGKLLALDIRCARFKAEGARKRPNLKPQPRKVWEATYFGQSTLLMPSD